MINEIISAASDSMNKTHESLLSDFSNVRTGRASTAVFDHIRVEAYGSEMPLNQTASIKAIDAQTIVIEPWDRSILGAVEKAIQGSDLGINPMNDGTLIRVSFPPLTEERRVELTKVCKNYAEDARVAIRNIRRDANQKVDKLSKEVSEDEIRRAEGEIQKITDAAIKRIDDSLKAKEAEVMAV